MSQRLQIFQHVPFEDAAHLAVWAQRQGFTTSVTRWFAGDPPPAADDFDWLVIMGGPMNIYEHRNHPWLVREKAVIAEAVRLKKKIVGVCLGAQLLADSLGARVCQNPHKEIGWLPVNWSPAAAEKNPALPGASTVLHWHGDTFDLPAGGEPVAGSAACANQGFTVGGHILAFQFHLESTPESVAKLCQNCRAELEPAAYVQTEPAILADHSHFAANHAILEAWLAWLAGN
jgi:GMP synthase (glutamine-hydrolysing)